MCGIAGFCSFKADFLEEAERWRRVLVGMRTAIAHRGRDQTGEYLQHRVGLSHTRLSIRDLAGGVQPMLRRRGGAEYGIVYNGEIYNAEELKQDLLSRGYGFETTCDTEVILCGYMEYGMEVAQKLNGIFAFAIWDGNREALFLCRDRLGVKPLFYAVKGDTLVFGSEPKALFAHPQIRPEADLDSFREIFGVGPARTPGCGVFRGLREVKPGCVLEGSLPDAVKLPEIGQREDQGDDGYRAVEAHLDGRQRPVKLVGDDLHDALAGQGDQVGGQIEKNAQGDEDHADEEIDQPHAIDHHRGEGHQRGIGQETICQKIGEVREIAKEGGADQLQDAPGLEVLPQKEELDGNVQRKYDDDPRPHGQTGVYFAEHVGDGVDRRHAQIGLAGKRHAHGHEKQAGTVAENAFAHLKGLLFHFTVPFPFWKHLLSGS